MQTTFYSTFTENFMHLHIVGKQKLLWFDVKLLISHRSAPITGNRCNKSDYHIEQVEDMNAQVLECF